MDAHSGVALVGVAPLQDRAHELVTLVAGRLNKDPSSFPQVTSDASLREFIQTMLAASSSILAASPDDGKCLQLPHRPALALSTTSFGVCFTVWTVQKLKITSS
jgi:hypothetical protein